MGNFPEGFQAARHRDGLLLAGHSLDNSSDKSAPCRIWRNCGIKSQMAAQPDPDWKEIVEQILPRACARQAREGAKALALGGRVGLSALAMAKVADDIRREYDGLAMAQQKLAELLASGGLRGRS